MFDIVSIVAPDTTIVRCCCIVERNTTHEVEQLIEHMIPDDSEAGNSIEAVYETTIKATFLIYQTADKADGLSKRSFAVRFYHDDSNDPDPVFPSGDYAAEVRDVTSKENYERDLGFDEIAGLLQIDPDKPVWVLEEEPDKYD